MIFGGSSELIRMFRMPAAAIVGQQARRELRRAYDVSFAKYNMHEIIGRHDLSMNKAMIKAPSKIK